MMLAGSTRTLLGRRLLARRSSSSSSVVVLARASSSGAPFLLRAAGISSAGSRSSVHRAIATTTTRAASSSDANGTSNGAGAPGKPARRPRVLSGVQPTGRLHLGNYLGAIRNWVGLQDSHDAFFCVVDLHAVTSPHDPKELREATRAMAAAYIAAGVDPKKAHIFVQSHVPAHAELGWLLECVTPVGWLGRMTQFKDKSRKMQQKQQEAEEEAAAAAAANGGGSAPAAENASVGTGLMTYPVLMAADILLYQADLVPVGEDQKQHLELARDLATRVNSQFGGKGWKKRGGRGGRLLTVPEPMIPPAGARVMSLLDGTAKMSKSADNDASRINLTDTPDQIRAKIKRCKTDAGDGGITASAPKSRPEAANLLTIYALCTNQTVAQAEAECSSLRWGDFKPRLADAVVSHLEPFQRRYTELMLPGPQGGHELLDEVLAEGAEAAAAVADATLWDVRDAMGFVAPRRDLVRRAARPGAAPAAAAAVGAEKKQPAAAAV
jgi:tryptophanyl-tRNA synthetase